MVDEAIVPQTRIYAMLLQKGFETKLFLREAATFEDMVQYATQEFGPGWLVVASVHCDVKNKEMPAMVRMDNIVKTNVATYINDLKYAKDTFATDENEKQAIDSVIVNIEKQYYGRSINAG